MDTIEEHERGKARDDKLNLLAEMLRVMAAIDDPETELLDYATGTGTLEVGPDAEGWLRHSADGSHYLIVRWKSPAPPVELANAYRKATLRGAIY